MDQVTLRNLVTRLERQRGIYMGDGINPGFTTTEVLVFLRLLNVVDSTQPGCYSNDTATHGAQDAQILRKD